MMMINRAVMRRLGTTTRSTTTRLTNRTCWSHRCFHSSTLFRQQQQQQQQQEESSPTLTVETTNIDESLTPQEVVNQLNRFIIGQNDAKKAVAIALRNRWRRHRLPSTIRDEIVPKNILMIGPTGVGKTEIARRLAKLTDAPFIKVEATKFTEVGFVGRDVDQIIRDLVDVAIGQAKQRAAKKNKAKVAKQTEEIILDCLVSNTASDTTREQMRTMLKSGELEDRMIDIELPDKMSSRMSTLPGPLQDGLGQIQDLFGMIGKKQKRRRMKIQDARPLIEDNEAEKIINIETIVKQSLQSVEQDGIVFIDEIDKICSGSGKSGQGFDASSEGVQRDLLPLIEGTTVSTKYGNVNTDYILFIASGAFHLSKPSDMLAELQGRLPIRVELQGLTEEDLLRILTEPENNILKQNIALLSTENLQLEFTDDAVKEIASIATEINSTVENIGARRLITVVEKILEEISFNAPEMAGQHVKIDAEMVKETVKSIMKRMDISKFVL